MTSRMERLIASEKRGVMHVAIESIETGIVTGSTGGMTTTVGMPAGRREGTSCRVACIPPKTEIV
jgi:hypothetical protein